MKSYLDNFSDFIHSRDIVDDVDAKIRISTYLIHTGGIYFWFFLFSFLLKALSEIRYVCLSLSVIAACLMATRVWGLVDKLEALPVALMGIAELAIFMRICVLTIIYIIRPEAYVFDSYAHASIIIVIVAGLMIWRELFILKIYRQAKSIKIRMIANGRRGPTK